jgi:hypothetical protein
MVWLLALVAMLPWLAALEHLRTLPAVAARRAGTDGLMWPGLLTAQIVGVIALALAVVATRWMARRAPHLVAGVLAALALVMGWVVRPLAWRHAPLDVFLIERGKIWVFWLGLSALGMVLVTGAGLLVWRSTRRPTLTP